MLIAGATYPVSDQSTLPTLTFAVPLWSGIVFPTTPWDSSLIATLHAADAEMSIQKHGQFNTLIDQSIYHMICAWLVTFHE